MASTPDIKQNNYFVSKIIEHAGITPRFRALISYLETHEGFSKGILEHDSLLNRSDFMFINPEGEGIKIKDIREFNSSLSYSGYTNAKRYIVFFNFETTTNPAQNAALKSIEEPPVNTQLLLLTSSHNSIIPTIISRCEVVYDSFKNKEKTDEEMSKLYSKITKSTHADLIDIAAQYKQRDEALKLSSRLLHFLHSDLKDSKSNYGKNVVAKDLKSLLILNQQLNQNCNVLLAVENCLFGFI